LPEWLVEAEFRVVDRNQRLHTRLRIAPALGGVLVHPRLDRVRRSQAGDDEVDTYGDNDDQNEDAESAHHICEAHDGDR
jgi:hypothetical protein